MSWWQNIWASGMRSGDEERGARSGDLELAPAGSPTFLGPAACRPAVLHLQPWRIINENTVVCIQAGHRIMMWARVE